MFDFLSPWFAEEVPDDAEGAAEDEAVVELEAVLLGLLVGELLIDVEDVVVVVVVVVETEDGTTIVVLATIEDGLRVDTVVVVGITVVVVGTGTTVVVVVVAWGVVVVTGETTTGTLLVVGDKVITAEVVVIAEITGSIWAETVSKSWSKVTTAIISHLFTRDIRIMATYFSI